VDISSVAFLGPLVENLLVQTLRQPLISSSSNERYSPAVIVADADQQDETQDIGLESRKPRKTATRIACTVLPVPTIRIDTEDVREALRDLWGGVRAVFTVSTESSEIACVLHLKIPNVPTRGRDTVKRKVREDQDKEEGEPYPPSPRLLEGIFVLLVWVHLYVYPDNARYTEEVLYYLQK
jgi:hypothetical protein